MKNYRPLSLTNTDYKIIANVISERLHKVIDKIISHDQSGYIRGRNITASVRQILDIFEYCESTNSPGAIICIDFEKAFDSIEHDFLYKVLEKFNFGKNFIEWIKVLYANPIFKIKNNGWLSEDCNLNRGVRQGCSMSALLFILVVEILALNIRQDEQIEGITIGNTEHKIVQYADDSTIFVKTVKSLEQLIKKFQSFGRASGLKLNMTKTRGIWLGGLKDQGLRISKGIHFTGNPVKMLGLYIGHNKIKMKEMNWDKKIESINKTILYWNKQNLSLFGKVKVIKTYVISKIVFIASLIEVPDEILAKIKSICFNYLWGGKRDKIKRTTVIGNKKDGGLDMIDIDAYIMSLKAAWVSKLLRIKGNWKKVFEHYVHSIGFKQMSYIFKMTFIDVKNFKIISRLPKFYVEVLIAFNKCKTVPTLKLINDHQLLTQPIWGNKLFQISGECLYFKAWISEGLLYIKDLINENGVYKTEDDLCNQITDRRKIIQELYMLKKGLLSKIKSKEVSNAKYVKIRDKTVIMHQNKFHEVTMKTSKFYYKCLRQKNISRGNMESIWSRNFKIDNSKFVWKNIYQQKIIDIDNAKLAEFNFKVMHNILPCGKVLSKWLNNSPSQCSNCGEIETVEHMLFKCDVTSGIWNAISEIINMNIRWKNIVCGLPSSENNRNVKFINLVISAIAYSIFKVSNKKRWGNDKHDDNILHMIVKDLLMYKLVFNHKGDNIFEDTRITKIVEKFIS